MTQVLVTKRLQLRPPSNEDIPNIVKYAGEKIIADGTINIPYPYTDQDAKNWLQLIKNAASKGKQISFGIYLEDEGFIGSIGLKLNTRFNHAETGYWIGLPFQGNGYATEALEAVLKYGFEELKLHKIFANHFESNPASAHVMLKCGMQKEATLIDHNQKGDQYLTVIQYCMFRNRRID